jgi:hypothetical protein
MTHNVHTPLYDEEKQQHYERVARLQYGAVTVNESIRRWNGYGKNRQAEILAEAGQIYQDMAAALESGMSAHSPEVEAILDRWQDNLRHFYEPTLDILRGLGEAYGTDPAFRETFVKYHPLLPDYLYEAIALYVDHLETAALEEMIAADEARSTLE